MATSIKTIFEELKRVCSLSGGQSFDCLEVEEYVLSGMHDNPAFGQWDYDTGATKLVLIFKDCDYVIKIPFTRDGDSSGHWSYVETLKSSRIDKDFYTSKDYTERETWVDNENDWFDGASVTGAIENAWDYCEAETACFKVAEAEGFGDCFAKTWLIGDIDGYPIYAQPKCITFDEERSSRPSGVNKTWDEDTRTIVRNSCSKAKYCGRLNEFWLCDFLEMFGEERLFDFLSFLERENFEDLHSGNVGYLDTVPVLIDYSGFWD